MANIKDSAKIAAKWTRVTPQRTEDYDAGIRNPTKDWKNETSAANENYKTAVTEAARKNRFKTGVEKAGTEKWQRKTLQKGLRNWGPGVSEAGPDYEAGFAPYREAIAQVTLPPRYPKGDPRNIARVAAIADALHKTKVGR